ADSILRAVSTGKWRWSPSVPVVLERRMPALCQGPRVPHPQRLVRAPRDDAFAVGAESQARDGIRVSVEREELLSGIRIPHLHRPVLASRDNSLTIRAVTQAGDAARVLPIENQD